MIEVILVSKDGRDVGGGLGSEDLKIRSRHPGSKIEVECGVSIASYQVSTHVWYQTFDRLTQRREKQEVEDEVASRES